MDTNNTLPEDEGLKEPVTPLEEIPSLVEVVRKHFLGNLTSVWLCPECNNFTSFDFDCCNNCGNPVPENEMKESDNNETIKNDSRNP